MRIPIRNARKQIVTLKTPHTVVSTFPQKPHAKPTNTDRNVEHVHRHAFDYQWKVIRGKGPSFWLKRVVTAVIMACATIYMSCSAIVPLTAVTYIRRFFRVFVSISVRYIEAPDWRKPLQIVRLEFGPSMQINRHGCHLQLNASSMQDIKATFRSAIWTIFEPISEHFRIIFGTFLDRF